MYIYIYIHIYVYVDVYTVIIYNPRDDESSVAGSGGVPFTIWEKSTDKQRIP